MDLELVVTGGTVVDGSGRAGFKADVGVRDGRIVALARGARLNGCSTLDATGLVVAPGFIDVHSHADWILPLADHDEVLAPLLLQGVTTVVTGQCGFSPAPVTRRSIPAVEAGAEMLRERPLDYGWRSMDEYLGLLASQGVMLNVATLVGHGTLRHAVLEKRTDCASPDEIDVLCRLACQAIREGAFGLSAGLAYAPGVFCRNQELLALLDAVAEENALFAVHGRAYSWVSSLYRPMILGTAHNIRSVREQIDLARRARVKLQLSHQIFVGRRTWRTHRKVLREIERAATDGVDVAFDAFPYTFGNTSINVVMPDWFLARFEEHINDPHSLSKFKREIDLLRLALGLDYRDITLLWGCAPELTELEGLDFEVVADRLEMSQFDAYMHVARLSNGRARVLLGTYSGDGDYEEPLRAVLAHPLCAFMTDTILTRHGQHNPASFGTFPRVLGRYSRDLALLKLEDAIHRMTAFPAERVGLSEVGQVKEGYWADLVLLDPATVADNTAPGRPQAAPSGIEAVLISGQVVARQGVRTDGERYGRVLRH